MNAVNPVFASILDGMCPKKKKWDYNHEYECDIGLLEMQIDIQQADPEVGYFDDDADLCYVHLNGVDITSALSKEFKDHLIENYIESIKSRNEYEPDYDD
jgi:hypothetical protein